MKEKNIGILDDMDLAILVMALEDFAETARCHLKSNVREIPAVMLKDIATRAMRLQGRIKACMNFRPKHKRKI